MNFYLYGTSVEESDELSPFHSRRLLPSYHGLQKNGSNGLIFLTAEQRCEELTDDGKETIPFISCSDLAWCILSCRSLEKGSSSQRVCGGSRTAN